MPIEGVSQVSVCLPPLLHDRLKGMRRVLKCELWTLESVDYPEIVSLNLQEEIGENLLDDDSTHYTLLCWLVAELTRIRPPLVPWHDFGDLDCSHITGVSQSRNTPQL
jgi:hypothetical protein